jgi:hypothetical protein
MVIFYLFQKCRHALMTKCLPPLPSVKSKTGFNSKNWTTSQILIFYGIGGIFSQRHACLLKTSISFLHF